MGIFARNSRPTTEKLAERIAELEARRDAIADELKDAQDALTHAFATGTDAAKPRADLAALEAEAVSLPRAIEALRAEIRSAHAESLQASRDAERAEIVSAYSKLEKRYAALRQAVDAFNDAIADAGPLGETHANDASIELRVGRRFAGEHYSVPIIGSIPDLDEVRSVALHRFDEVTKQRIASVGGSPGPRSGESAEAYFFDGENGRLRPVSERPERERSEPKSTMLARNPAGASDKAERRLPPPSLRNVAAPQIAPR